MEMETRRSRTIDSQFTALVDFMERHGDIGKAQSGPHDRVLADQLWEKLAHLLNVVDGGVKRTPDKWKKVWSDWKSKSKLRAQAIRQHGSGQKHKKPLTELEKRVAALLRRSTGISEQGLNRIPKLEAESSNEEIHFVLIDESNVCETSIPASTLPQANKQETSSSSTSSESDREASPHTNRASSPNSRLHYSSEHSHSSEHHAETECHTGVFRENPAQSGALFFFP